MGFVQAIPADWLLAGGARPVHAGAIEFFLLLTAISLLAILGLRLRVVDDSGAAAGFCASALISLALGWRGLTLVLVLALIAAGVTRFHDAHRATGETRHKHRSAGEILANLAPAALCLSPLFFTSLGRHAICAAFVAALAESAADTTASEIGESLGGQPILLTTLQPAPLGADGAISRLGTLCASAAAALLVTLALWLGLVGPLGAALAFLTAFAGLFFDSLLGATFERAGRIGNNTVNFVSSTFAAACALLLWSLLALALFLLRRAS